MIKIIFQTVKEKIKQIRKFFQGVCERCDPPPIDPPYSLDCYALKLVKKQNIVQLKFRKMYTPSEMLDSYTLR